MKHDFARKLRREQTDVERKLWSALRDRRVSGFKFRRQQPIGAYIADFVCFDAKLIVELDGSQHGASENIAAELARTKFLEGEGFRVLRFWNHEVNQNFEGVLDAILRALTHQSPHLKDQGVERRSRAANPMIFLPLPRGERGNFCLRRHSNPL